LPGVPRREGPRQVLGLPRRGALVEVLRVLLAPVLDLRRRRGAPAYRRHLPPPPPDPRPQRARHRPRHAPRRARAAAVPEDSRSWPLASAAATARREGGREGGRHGPLPRELVVRDAGVGAVARAVAVGVAAGCAGRSGAAAGHRRVQVRSGPAAARSRTRRHGWLAGWFEGVRGCAATAKQNCDGVSCGPALADKSQARYRCRRRVKRVARPRGVAGGRTGGEQGGWGLGATRRCLLGAGGDPLPPVNPAAVSSEQLCHLWRLGSQSSTTLKRNRSNNWQATKSKGAAWAWLQQGRPAITGPTQAR
jgi:hypothetical protein